MESWARWRRRKKGQASSSKFNPHSGLTAHRVAGVACDWRRANLRPALTCLPFFQSALLLLDKHVRIANCHHEHCKLCIHLVLSCCW
jgi:hypothetical protein